jgi:hypothetical protein
MNTTSNADAGKTFCGRERPHFGLAFLGQNPFGLRGSLPATASTEIRFFGACAASVFVLMLPRILGNFCQASLANLARTLGHVLPEIHFVREEKHRAFAQAT